MKQDKKNTTAADAIGREVCTAATDRRAWHPDVAALYEYWRRITPAGSMPGRQHFDPVDIPALLSRTSLYDVERTEPLRFRYRLFGSRNVQALGRDLTGQYLNDETTGSGGRDRLFADLVEIVRNGLPIYRRQPSELLPDGNGVLVESCFAPLARDGVNVDMIVGVTVWSSVSGRLL